MRTVFSKRTVGLLLALLLFSSTAEVIAAESKRIRLAFAGFGIGTVITWIASEKKLFAPFGLNVDELYLEGPSAGGVQALFGVDFFMASGEVLTPVSAITGGAELVVLAAHTSKEHYQFGVASNITAIQELKGKKVGVSGLGRKSDLIARVVLRRAGLDPLTDVEIVPVGFSPQRAAALYRDQVQGAPLIPAVAMEAKRIGLKILNIGEVQLVTDLLMTTRARFEHEPDVIRKLLKGYLTAIHFFLTNREESIRIMEQHVDLTNGVSLTNMYQSLAAQLDPVPLPSDEAIQALIDAASVADVRAQKLTKEKLLEPQFLEDLKKSGFVAGLYSEKVSL